MTIKVLKSSVHPDFARMVEIYRLLLEKHRFTINEPAPTADALIMQCVRRIGYPVEDQRPDDFVADYVILDDTPPPPTLEERKTALHVEVSIKEAASLAAICPIGKRRLTAMKMMEIHQKEVKTAEEEAFLAAQDEIQLRTQAVNLAGATMMAEIDDLTEETITGWQIKPFE